MAKQCNLCKEIREPADFYWSWQTADHRENACKFCKRAKARQRAAARKRMSGMARSMKIAPEGC